MGAAGGPATIYSSTFNCWLGPGRPGGAGGAAAQCPDPGQKVAAGARAGLAGSFRADWQASPLLLTRPAPQPAEVWREARLLPQGTDRWEQMKDPRRRPSRVPHSPSCSWRRARAGPGGAPGHPLARRGGRECATWPAALATDQQERDVGFSLGCRAQVTEPLATRLGVLSSGGRTTCYRPSERPGLVHPGELCTQAGLQPAAGPGPGSQGGRPCPAAHSVKSP